MIKKVSISIIIIAMCISVVSMFYITFAAEDLSGNQVLQSNQATELLDIKESATNKFANYIEKYGSVPFGITAYILNILRIYSIPFCFIGIAIGSVYQYVIGIRKLDIRDRGFLLIITFVTILMICQVLPLIFAIVVNGWRG